MRSDTRRNPASARCGGLNGSESQAGIECTRIVWIFFEELLDQRGVAGKMSLRQVTSLLHVRWLARRPAIHRNNHGPVLLGTGEKRGNSEQKKENYFHSEAVIVV
jgi:hypothetical protein